MYIQTAKSNNNSQYKVLLPKNKETLAQKKKIKSPSILSSKNQY